MKKSFKVLLCVLTLIVAFSFSASAIVPYATFTYNINGDTLESPHAYVPDRVIDSAFMNLAVDMNDPKDLFVDANGNIYIADTKNNRIIVCDSQFKPFMFLDSFVNTEGVYDSLLAPSGVYVTEEFIYVADTDNYRIVVFNIDGTFSRIIEEPKADVFPEGHIYKPIALAVDRAGRLYVVSSTTHYGIITLYSDGTFMGFLGAQKSSLSAWDIFWRMFRTAEQIARSEKVVPTEYNNITIDKAGFVYATTNSLDKGAMRTAILGKSVEGTYAPVKMLNNEGTDVLNRTGFYPPSGEVPTAIGNMNGGTAGEVSSVTDVALGPNGMWSLFDSLRQRIYTYDEQGKLLFIFGDNGTQIGQLQNCSSIVYHGTDLLALDVATDSITVFKRTDYGDYIATALQNTIDRKYDTAIDYWKSLLQRNSNLDQAYVGIGDSLYREYKYEEAMEYYEASFDTAAYSDCFKQLRKQWIEKYILIIPVVVIVVCFVVSKFFKYANKVNKEGYKMKEKRSLKEAFLYGFHVIFHPFDGFWDLKHEKRGNMKGALLIGAITIAAFIYHGMGKSYIFAPNNMGVNIVAEIAGLLTPYLLWCIANWCLTTLFDGEGSFKDICIATAYAVLPLPLILIPATMLTNIIVAEEASLITLLINFGWIWTGFLLFFGMMVTHDYSLSKNVLTSLGTLVGMAFIMFVGVLFSGLLTKLFSFFYNIYVELSYRI
ncbi:MAG: hypothetical protein E7665_09095 [Ruminococcaceae bacterium]|nr:hypothetical protein [Oscillospiraceae bacterium]